MDLAAAAVEVLGGLEGLVAEVPVVPDPETVGAAVAVKFETGNWWCFAVIAFSDSPSTLFTVCKTTGAPIIVDSSESVSSITAAKANFLFFIHSFFLSKVKIAKKSCNLSACFSFIN
jgi:hypothetical protein